MTTNYSNKNYFSKKNSEINSYKTRINNLKRSSRQNGYTLTKRLEFLYSKLQFFLQHLNNRINLSKLNISIILEQELISTRKTKLQSSNKIHNFTNLTLPDRFTTLLNKGTNFIPTTTNRTPNNLESTISSEVNSALQLIINKQKQHNATLKSNPTKSASKRFQPHLKRNHIKLLQQEQSKPNFNFNVIDYVYNTVLYTKHNLQSTNFTKRFYPQQTNITASSTEHIHKLQTSTDKNMYPSHGSLRNTNNILTTPRHTDESTILTLTLMSKLKLPVTKTEITFQTTDSPRQTKAT